MQRPNPRVDLTRAGALDLGVEFRPRALEDFERVLDELNEALRRVLEEALPVENDASTATG